MKRMLFLLLLTAIGGISVSAQEKNKNKDKDSYDDRPKIEGSGNIVTKDYPVQSFDQLDVQGVFNVQLSQDSKAAVKIEADDNLQSLFEVKNEGSKLSISMKKDMNFSSKKKLVVYISFDKLKSIDLKTVGNLASTESLSFDNLELDNKSVGSVDLKLTANKVDIDNKSVGDIKLSGKADNVTIKNKSVGSIQAASFVVQTMDIDNNGVGSAEVNAAKDIKVKDSFLGKVTNKGAATIKRTNKTVI
jgi:hypothetical protein